MTCSMLVVHAMFLTYVFMMQQKYVFTTYNTLEMQLLPLGVLAKIGKSLSASIVGLYKCLLPMDTVNR